MTSRRKLSFPTSEASEMADPSACDDRHEQTVPVDRPLRAASSNGSSDGAMELQPPAATAVAAPPPNNGQPPHDAAATAADASAAAADGGGGAPADPPSDRQHSECDSQTAYADAAHRARDGSEMPGAHNSSRPNSSRVLHQPFASANSADAVTQGRDPKKTNAERNRGGGAAQVAAADAPSSDYQLYEDDQATRKNSRSGPPVKPTPTGIAVAGAFGTLNLAGALRGTAPRWLPDDDDAPSPPVGLSGALDRTAMARPLTSTYTVSVVFTTIMISWTLVLLAFLMSAASLVSPDWARCYVDSMQPYHNGATSGGGGSGSDSADWFMNWTNFTSRTTFTLGHVYSAFAVNTSLYAKTPSDDDGYYFSDWGLDGHFNDVDDVNATATVLVATPANLLQFMNISTVQWFRDAVRDDSSGVWSSMSSLVNLLSETSALFGSSQAALGASPWSRYDADAGGASGHVADKFLRHARWFPAAGGVLSQLWAALFLMVFGLLGLIVGAFVVLGRRDRGEESAPGRNLLRLPTVRAQQREATLSSLSVFGTLVALVNGLCSLLLFNVSIVSSSGLTYLLFTWTDAFIGVVSAFSLLGAGSGSGGADRMVLFSAPMCDVGYAQRAVLAAAIFLLFGTVIAGIAVSVARVRI